MKTKKVIAFLLTMIVALALGAFTACTTPDDQSEEPTELTIIGETEVTVEVNQPYKLEYTCSGTVTVSVSGGNYKEESREFTATAAGNYTITVTGVETGKKETVKTVSVTVVAAADKTAIRDALAKTGGLIDSDYTTASWASLNTAKKAAEEKLEAQGVTQADVDAVAAAVEAKMKALVPATFDKATLTENSFTWNGTVYSEDDFENLAEALVKVEALNADASASLRSVYTAKINEIIDELVEKLWLQISGLPDGAKLIAETLGAYTLTAQTDAGASFVWKLDGAQVATTAEYAFTPAAFDTEYTVSCTATKNGLTATKSVTVSFTQADYAVNGAFTNGITVENNVIKVNEFYTWNNQKGKKVTFSDFYLAGDFTVYFDLKLTENGSNATRAMALFLLDAQGNPMERWVAVVQQSNWLEVKLDSTAEGTVRKVMPGGDAIELNTLLHFRFTRTVKDNVSYLTADLLDDYGNVIMTNDGDGLSFGYTGAIMLGLQTEFLKFELSNLAVNADADCFRKAPLRDALAAAQAGGYLETDYTADTWAQFTSAMTGVQNELANTASTSASVKGALDALEAAIDGLTLASVEKLDVNAESVSFTYREKEYREVEYENWDAVLAEIVALNANTEVVKNSVYQAALVELLGRLTVNFKEAVITGERGNIILEEMETYTYKANHVLDATYLWKVNGTKKLEAQNAETFEFTPEAFDTEYKVEVIISRNGTTFSDSLTVSFTQADFVVANGNSSVDGNVAHIGTGIRWDNNEGRNFALEQLVFNGSFSIAMDFVWDAWASDNHSAPHVITFHLLKADEYNYYNSGDRPTFHCYGALLLHDQAEGQRLEVNHGLNKMEFGKQNNIHFNVGDTVSIKLTAMKGTNNKYYMTFSVKNPNNGEWIDYRLEEGAYWESEAVNSGVMVGVNIENLGATLKNFRYELISDGTHLNGSVLSKLAFQKALREYETAYNEYAQYANGVEFLEAYQAALRAYTDNSDSADYGKALQKLEEAYARIGDKQNVFVSVEGLDHGANKIRGNALTAVIDNDKATDIYWTWNKDQEGTQNGKTLPLTEGAYTGLTLHFKVDDTAYTYRYQNFTVVSPGLKPTSDKVAVGADNKVTVTDGNSWSNSMLEFENLAVREFELSFDIKKLAGYETADNIVVAIRTNDRSEARTAVIGFKRGAVNGAMHIGYNGGTGYVEPFSDEVRDELWKNGAHVVLRQVLRPDYTVVQTFSIYKADGTFVASQNSEPYRLHRYGSNTDIRFSFENINCELTNVRLGYFE